MHNKTKAIILMNISALAFSLSAASVKFAPDISAFQKVFVRGFFAFIISLIISLKNKEFTFGKRENQKYLILRSLAGMVAMGLYFYSIDNMVMADAVTLNKTSPFFILILAAIFLKEKISTLEFISILIAFIGVVFIVNPKFTSNPIIPSIASLISGFLAGVAYVTVRKLSGKESPTTIIMYFSFVIMICYFPMTIVYYKQPTLQEWLALLMIGIFALIGQFSMTYSYKYAEASEVSVYHYMQVIFSAIIGYFVWFERINIYSGLGILLILLSGYMNYRAVRKNKN